MLQLALLLLFFDLVNLYLLQSAKTAELVLLFGNLGRPVRRGLPQFSGLGFNLLNLTTKLLSFSLGLKQTACLSWCFPVKARDCGPPIIFVNRPPAARATRDRASPGWLVRCSPRARLFEQFTHALTVKK